jgi:hypothetical protein
MYNMSYNFEPDSKFEMKLKMYFFSNHEKVS